MAEHGAGGSSRRRVLFCTLNYYPHAAGGAEQQARLQAEELVRRGHRVTVVCPRWRGTRSGWVNGVQVWRVPIVDRRPFRLLSYHLSLFLCLLPRLKRYQVAHVHLAHYQSDVLLLAGLLAGRRLPVYVKLAAGGELGDVHRVSRLGRFTRFAGLRGAARLQALSDEIERELLAVGVAPSHIVRLPNGVDSGTFRPAYGAERNELRRSLGLPETERVVLFAGRFARHKGLHHLVDVWSRLEPHAARLVLLGSSNTMDPIGALPDLPSLDVRGWTTDTAPYFRSADIFVLPSYVEGMSNALLEAMACGAAVIASRVGAAETLIRDGENGLLIDAGDEAGLERALARLLCDAELRCRLGQQATRTIRERYSIESVVDRIERVYAEIGLPA